MPLPDRDDLEYGCGLSLGLNIALTSSRPGHTRVSPKCTHNKGLAPVGDAPLSSELRHCTAYPELARKPLGLNP